MEGLHISAQPLYYRVSWDRSAASHVIGALNVIPMSYAIVLGAKVLDKQPVN